MLSRVRVSALVLMLVLASSASASDLDAAGDGEHLWLVIENPEPETEGEAGLLVYHLHADPPEGTPPGAMFRLDPLAGELMPRELTAGGGKLLMVMSDRKVKVIRPARSELLRRWVYQQRTLPALPQGCSLLSVAMSNRGPWALVRVNDPALLEQLDRDDTPQPRTDHDQRMLNRALGLPDDFNLTPGDDESEPTKPSEPAESETSATPQTGSAPDAEQQADAQADADSDVAGSSETPPPDAQDKVPAYRLLHLRGSRWTSSPLPDDMLTPRRAELVMRDDDTRPTLIIETDATTPSPGQLVRYLPVEIDNAEPVSETQITESDAAAESAWQLNKTLLEPSAIGRWSAMVAERQAVIVLEQSTTDRGVVTEARVLRGDQALARGTLDLPTDGPAKWAAVPWAGGVALVARPGPTTDDAAADGKTNDEPLGALRVIDLNGDIIRLNKDSDAKDTGIVTLTQAKTSAADANADRFVQIGAFVLAMLLMLAFYKRAITPQQIDLPEQFVLAPFGRRLVAGFIDLIPGFWIAGLVFDIGVNQTLLYWPGNGMPKVLSAMQPGFVVIGVTLLHTAILEAITARSIGKWMTGLRVTHLNGQRPGLLPIVARSLARVFDLLAPLILVLAVISPARQRLGDILARTLVVGPKPDDPDLNQPRDDDGY